MYLYGGIETNGRCPYCNFLLIRNVIYCPNCKKSIFQRFPQQPLSEENEDIIKNNHSKADIKNINLKWKTIYKSDILIPVKPYERVQFNFKKGERIKGTIISTDDSLFDCHIISEIEFFKYKKNINFNSIKSFENVSSAIFDLDIPYSDRWYFTFTKKLKNPKTIQVVIKKLDMDNKKMKP